MKLIAGNWKMHKTVPEALEFVVQLQEKLSKKKPKTEVLICPPFTSLYALGKVLHNSKIKLGSQNVFYKDEGAFTGEISPLMLKDCNCEYALIGHSERRKYGHITSLMTNLKIKDCLKHKITPILCVGEDLELRNDNEMYDFVEHELNIGLRALTKKQVEKIIIAYEPIWAIGTGKTATPKIADEMHKFIKSFVKKKFGVKVRVLYGGSVKPSNVKKLMAMKNIDGALVGGAALDVKTFSKLIYYNK